MSGFDWLILIGLALLALPGVVYPLVLLFLRPRRSTAIKAELPDWVILATGEVAEHHRRRGFPVVGNPKEAAGRILILPARGRLSFGGIRRLLAPLSSKSVGLVVGRLLAPEVEESGREGGTAAAFKQARRITQNWRWFLGSREARAGVPASVDGFPVAMRPEFYRSTRAESLILLEKSQSRVSFLHGKGRLVGRQPVEESLDPLVDELTTSFSAGRQTITRRWKNLGVLLRFGVASLTPLWLFMALLGAGMGLLESGGELFYKLILVLAGGFLLGAVVGGLTLKYGYRSRVYFPFFWLVAGLAAIVRSYSQNSDVKEMP